MKRNIFLVEEEGRWNYPKALGSQRNRPVRGYAWSALQAQHSPEANTGQKHLHPEERMLWPMEFKIPEDHPYLEMNAPHSLAWYRYIFDSFTFLC